MAAVFERIRDWTGFFALLFLQRILVLLVASGYKRLKARIDATLPDDLPIGAGPWLEEQIAKRQVAVRVIVDPSGGDEGDAYFPAAKTLVLSREVWGKHDASFWAVAAHELGHVLVYRRSAVLRAFFLGARVASRALSQSAVMLLVGNVLYGIPEIDRVAFTLLFWSLAAHVVILVDETSASVVARNMLAGDERLEGRGRSLGTIRLVAALLTYVAGFVGQIVLVWRSDLIAARIEARDPFVPAAPIGPIRTALVAISVIGILGLAAFEIVSVLRRRRYPDLDAAAEATRQAWWRDVVRGSIAIAVVVVIWDQPRGLVLELACVAAIFGSRAFLGVLDMIASRAMSMFVYVFFLPASVLWDLVVGIVRRMRGLPAPSPPAPRTAAPQTATTPDTRFEEMLLASYDDPPWWRRAAVLVFAGLHVAFGIVTLVLLFG